MKNTGSLQFIYITAISSQQIEQVRVIRNHSNIRKYMYTDHIISSDEHRRWLKGLEGDESRKAFVIFKGGKLIGLVSLSKISDQHGTADWAFYLDPEEQGGGTGVQVEYALLEYAFEEMGLEKLNCEVLSINPNVVKLHQKFGFQDEGFRRENIVKEDERIGIHLLGITIDEWRLKKPNFERIMSRYAG